MKKGVVVVVGILVILAVIFGLYSMSKKTPRLVNKIKVTTENKPTASKTETAQGTFRSLLSSEKSQKCTYSYDRQAVSVSGTIYVVKGKMRGDFVSSSTQSKVSGHLVVSDNYLYVWTDMSNRGIKMLISQQSSPVSTNSSQMLDINQTFTYSCQGWTEDDSLFALPSTISFMTFALPASSPSTAVGSAPSAGASPSAACSICDRIPAGSGRDACRAQLHCQ